MGYPLNIDAISGLSAEERALIAATVASPLAQHVAKDMAIVCDWGDGEIVCASPHDGSRFGEAGSLWPAWSWPITRWQEALAAAGTK